MLWLWLWSILVFVAQALLDHVGKEDTLVRRLVEKYGAVAWDHFEMHKNSQGGGAQIQNQQNNKNNNNNAAASTEAVEECDDSSLTALSALHSVLRASLAIVGLHADQAADQIAFHGFLYQKPWVC